MKLFCGYFSRLEDTCWAKKVPEGSSEGSTTHQGAPRWVVPSSVAFRTSSSPYKSPNILETLGEPTKYNSSRRKVQNGGIQSRHHH